MNSLPDGASMNFIVDPEKEIHKVVKRAGARYQPETNVKLPIIKFFDAFTRNDSFLDRIKTLYGELFRNLASFNSNDSVMYTRFNEYNFQKNLLKKRLRRVFRNCSSELIKWNLISIHIRFLRFYVLDFISILEKEKSESPNGISGQEQQTIESKVYFLKKAVQHLNQLYEISTGKEGLLSNAQFLLLSGAAGNGKTHLLVDLFKERLHNDEPTIFLFGEQFSRDTDVWEQLKSKTKSLKNRNWLQEFEIISTKTNKRGLIIIDALNESGSSFWLKNLKNVYDQLIKYPNILLVISIRDGYESEVINPDLKKELIEIKHSGFPQDLLWDATEKYFEYYNITYPDFPLLNPEFKNPLFLYFFCKVNKNTSLNLRQANGNGLKMLFERYVVDVGHEEVLKKLNPSCVKKIGNENIIWNDVMKKGITPIMIRNNSYYINEKELRIIIQKVFPEIDSEKVIKLLENSNILNSFFYSKEKYFKYPFDKFSNHIIIRTLLSGIPKEKREVAFNEENEIGQFINKNKHNFGIVEAFCVQAPDFCNKEIFELSPFITSYPSFWEAFTESIIWRNPKKMGASFIELLRKNLSLKKEFLLTPILNLSHVPDHPLNASFLDEILFSQSMVERDSWWSIYLHNTYYDEGDIVSRLINWSINKNDKQKLSDQSIQLVSTTLSWFLTSSNRYIRDKTTKGLVQLLKDKPLIASELIEHFDKVNDIYILERLYCVCYGVVLFNQDNPGTVESLCMKTYDLIFKDGNPPEHLLLRDYAKEMIDFLLRKKIELEIDKTKIYPPYSSKLPDAFPSNSYVEKLEFDYKDKDFKDYFFSQNAIIHSMQPEHTTIKGNMYGDFGRYIFQSAIENWDLKSIKCTVQDLSNFAVKIIFAELKYDVALLGQFDRELYRSSVTRNERKPERIGKKYQWIAFQRILSVLADNAPLKDAVWREKTIPYAGCWNPNVRDIDPTILITAIKNKSKPSFNSLKTCYEKYDITADSLEKWISSKKDVLGIESLLDIKDDATNSWLLLNGSYRWEEATLPEEKRYELSKRELWIMFQSYLVRKNDLNKLFESLKSKSFWGRWMPEGVESYAFFLGEYPLSKAYEDSCGRYDDWTDKSQEGKLPVSILPTKIEYSNEKSYDLSKEESLNVRVPNKEIIQKMGLTPNFTGDYYHNRELSIFENSLLGMGFPNAMICNKKQFQEFLKKNDLSLFWAVIGEKTLVGDHTRSSAFKPKEFSQLVFLNSKGSLEIISESED